MVTKLPLRLILLDLPLYLAIPSSLLSDWICRLCYEALQACVNAHNRYLLSLEKLKNKASSVINHKRYWPLEESPRSLPTQPSKVRKVQLRGRVVGSKVYTKYVKFMPYSYTTLCMHIINQKAAFFKSRT